MFRTRWSLFARGGCGEVATVPDEAGMGPRPALPPPNPALMPTVARVASAIAYVTRLDIPTADSGFA
jgi:hypothetical protein